MDDKKTWYSRAVKALNLCLVTLPLAYGWFFYYAEGLHLPHPMRLGAALTFVFFVFYFLIGHKIYDAFRISFFRVSELCLRQFLAYLIDDTCLFIGLWYLSGKYLSGKFPNIVPALYILGVQLVFSVLWCILAKKWYIANYPPNDTALIYSGDSSFDETILRYGRESRFHIVGKYSAEECLQDMSVIDRVQIVFLDMPQSSQRNEITAYCMSKGITCFLIPTVHDAIMSSAIEAHMMYTPMLKVSRSYASPEYAFLKRFFDIVLSGALIVIFSPLMAAVALLVRRDGGPALFKQARLTKDGKIFTLIKFRSMIVDAEKDGKARLSTGENDDRITPVGRKIRACRLDEFPQLFNIFRGDMSFVGPRPERPEIAAQYEENLPEFRLRLQVKAGLTGLAQIYGQYNTPPEEKLKLDLFYIANASIWEDMRLFFATFSILFEKDSTEGVEKGKTTAMDQNK